MGFFKRAITSVTRKIGKTSILLALVFVLGNVIAGAISIEQSIRNTENSILRGMVPVTTVEIDWSKPNLDYDNIRNITVEQIERLGALEMVEYFDYSNSSGLTSKTLKRYTDPNASTPDRPINEPGYEETVWFRIIGGQSGEIMDRKMNKIRITDGREPNDEEVSGAKNVVVISKQLAELNNIHVGSVFTLETEIYKYNIDYDIVVPDIPYEPPKPEKILEFEFTVVGLFERVGPPPSYNPNDMYNYMEMERPNNMYASNNVIKSINDIIIMENKQVNPEMDYGYETQYYTPFFILKDMDSVTVFSDESKAILPDYYRVLDNTSKFKEVTAPMENMSSIAMIILWVGIGASLLILSLLITLFLRDRRHEIGIYLSLGERKLKIVGQVLSEVVVISIIAITLSLFSGNIISGILSNSMIENQVIAQQQAEGNSPGYVYREYNILESMGYNTEVTLEDLADQYNVSLGADIILSFYAAGILTVLVSTLIPILYVLRLNPRKILM